MNHLMRTLTCRKMKIAGFLLTILTLTLSHECRGQEFVAGINLYNRAEYDSLIKDYAPAFIAEHPQAAGVARYFVAESHYNLGLAAADAQAGIRHFRKARTGFSEAVNSPDVKGNHAEYLHSARYKIGWCSFRLAELGVAAVRNLRRAYEEFQQIAASAPDSIKMAAWYMAAKSQILRNNLLVYDLLQNQQDVGQASAIVASFKDAARLQEQILSLPASASTPQNLERFKALVSLEKEILTYHLGNLYLRLPGRYFNRIEDANKLATPEATAQAYFERADYDSSLAAPRWDAERTYLSLMNAFRQYSLTRDEAYKTQMLQLSRAIARDDLKSELQFRTANLYHSNPDTDSDDFRRHAMRFYEAARDIPESLYWLGYLAMIQNDREGSSAFTARYLQSATTTPGTVRKQVLREDALYRKYLLEFEAFYLNDNTPRLQTLQRQVARFAPQNPATRERKEQLHLLINCSLTPNTAQIWDDVLSGSDAEKMEEALSTVRFVLPRAALNIGIIREKYLRLLQRLLDVTRVRRSDETRFFRGVVQSLEAEIQATPDEKITRFKQAAATLSQISSDFAARKEADYVRARCLFFAEEFERAQAILETLVNEHHYLRAVFYLAEIFRATGEDTAARQCYQAILNALRNVASEYADFWRANARAGLVAAEDAGTPEAVASLDLQNIRFQPEVQPGLLSYETLADEHFLIRKAAQESVAWLTRYGLPQKEFYPSQNRMRHSFILHENVFESVRGLFDEVRQPITSSLNLTVLLPEGVRSPTKVWLGDEKLSGNDGAYVRQAVPLNARYEIAVRNPDCYPFQNSFQFSKPGENKLVVVLNKKLRYSVSGDSYRLTEDDDYPFGKRWDANYVLNRIPVLELDSELLLDFTRRFELRDVVHDKTGNRILAVNAETDEIWTYSPDPLSKQTGRLPLADTLLNSPEGIAVDTQGNIYVSDWGHHRILILNHAGEVQSSIGSYGSNADRDVGDSIRLTFPTRVAVLEDTEGVQVDGQTYHRETYLCITDHYGLHLCRRNGDYLGTLIPPGAELPEGAFYGFNVEGYGRRSKLNLVGRLGQRNGRVFEFVAK